MIADILIPGLGFGELVIFLILLIIGIVAILILSAVIHFILPIIAAVVVWLLAGSLLYAGVAFVVVALLQLIVRRR
jgi:membrane protein implicated in regulation of membrane protease activity